MTQISFRFLKIVIANKFDIICSVNTPSRKLIIFFYEPKRFIDVRICNYVGTITRSYIGREGRPVRQYLEIVTLLFVDVGDLVEL